MGNGAVGHWRTGDELSRGVTGGQARGLWWWGERRGQRLAAPSRLSGRDRITCRQTADHVVLHIAHPADRRVDPSIDLPSIRI